MAYKRKTKLNLTPPKTIDALTQQIVEEYHGHPLFYKIVEELKQLHHKKNKDYASKDLPLGNFIRTGRLIKKLLKPTINQPLAAAMILMAKQVDAVYDMIGEGKEPSAESVYDKFRDIAVYSVIAMIIITEVKANKKEYLG